MKKLGLIGIIVLLVAGSVFAAGGGGGGGTAVTRTFNYANPTDFPNTVYTGDSIGATYARMPSSTDYWAVDDYIPDGWDVTEQSPVSNRLRFYTTEDNKIYNFVPATAGEYTFNDGLFWNYGDDSWYGLINEIVTVVNCVQATEDCDGTDNDCDYQIDEDLSRECSENNYGICAVGSESCTAGSWTGCPTAETETCNNMDDDCDNSVDEELTRDCSENYLGECAIGTETCSAGQYSGCRTPVEEDTIGSCDGKDNDCDGETDETKNTDADTDCDGCVSPSEFTAYANKWIAVEVSNADFVAVANKWITLEGCTE